MSTLTTTPIAPRLRAAGIASLVGAAGFVLLFILTNFIATTIAPLPDFPLPVDAPKYVVNGIFNWFGSTAWSIGLIVAVVGANRLLAASDSVVASVVRIIGVVGAGVVALGAGNGFAQFGVLVESIADSGADEGAQKAVYAATWLATNAYVFTAILLLSVWLVAGAVLGLRSAAISVPSAVLAMVFAVLATVSTVVTRFPAGGIVLTLYLAIAGIVYLVGARRASARA